METARCALKSPGEGFKTCRVCGVELPIEFFAPKHDNADGYMTACRECNRKQAREWYERNRETHIANVLKAQRRNHSRKTWKPDEN